jgi:hypothetical protein
MTQSFLLVPTEELNKMQQQLSELKLLIQQIPGLDQKQLGDWISQDKAIELLGVKETSLYKLRRDKQLVATQTRPIFYSLKSIQEYLKKKS